MTKPLRRTPTAERETRQAIQWYHREAGSAVAARFVASLNAALKFIVEQPHAASPRYGDLVGLSQLRAWRLKDFPWIVFFVERADHLQMLRLLHAHRDIPDALGQDQ